MDVNFKPIIKLLITGITLLSFTACGMFQDKKYLVSIYELNEGSDFKSIQNFYHNTKKYIRSYGARYLGYPAEKQNELINSAAPDYISKFPGKYLIVAEFKDEPSLRSYIAHGQVIQEMDILSEKLSVDIVFIAKLFNPMGMLPDYPVYGDLDPNSKPSFLLVNAISMKSFLSNPLTPFRMMNYMDTNTPKLESIGTKILAPLVKEEEIRGKFNYEVLFFTKWKNEETFAELHNDHEFIELTKTTRNVAFEAFTDTKMQFLLNNDM